MNSPKVSVIIPTYAGADYLGETIQSVLNQTYTNFELIVVNDASPDNTAETIQQFEDERLIYLVHETNQGAMAARETGLEVCSGDIIAFLDQDDLFHPEKLETHVAFLTAHPEIGVSYNGRFEIQGETKVIREIWQPPLTVTLEDMIVTFPFAPSDTMFRREWAFKKGIWDIDTYKGDEVIVNGLEYVYCGKLYFAGCKFAGIGRALNYRRYHPNRYYSDLERRCKSEHACQELILSDPRCPSDAVAVRDTAHMRTNLVWAYYAFAQNETELGQKFLIEAIQLDPSILEDDPCRLLDFLLMNSIAEDGRDHPELLRSIFDQLPAGVAWSSGQLDWAAGLGHLLKGSRAVMWGQPEVGQQYFARAAQLKAKVDETFVNKLTYQLLLYEREFGPEAARMFLQNLSPYFDQMGDQQSIRTLKGNYAIGQAFQSYKRGEFRQVPGEVVRAIRSDPRYVSNRGVWSIMFRSLVFAR